MVRVNHAREKRLKELDRQRKQEQKRAKRLERGRTDGTEEDLMVASPSDSEETPEPAPEVQPS